MTIRKKAIAYEEGLDYHHYYNDYPSTGFEAGYKQALADIKAEIELTREAIHLSRIESSLNEGKLIALHDLAYFIDNTQ